MTIIRIAATAALSSGSREPKVSLMTEEITENMTLKGVDCPKIAIPGVPFECLVYVDGAYRAELDVNPPGLSLPLPGSYMNCTIHHVSH